MTIIIKEITAKEELKEFVKFPSELYANNKNYVPPLYTKELNGFIQDKNPAFSFCIAKYWLAYKEGKIVGRIAGIINYNYNKKRNIKYARFGWLDFVNEQEVLQLLLKTVEQWAISKNMTHIHGPLGFTSFDASGILIEGFDELTTSFAHYNFPYYSEFIEKFGYKKDVDWIESRIKMTKKLPDKIIEGSKIVQKRYNLVKAEISSKKHLLKYADELFSILNKSYKDLFGFSDLTKRQIGSLKKQFLTFISLDYISIILDKEDKLIAFGLAIPSMSKALIKSKGKLFPFGFYRMWRALKKNDTVDLLLIAVEPKYQNKGVHAMIFEEIGQAFINNKIKYIETTRELENNTKIIQLWKKFNPQQHKKSRCYIKSLNIKRNE